MQSSTGKYFDSTIHCIRVVGIQTNTTNIPQLITMNPYLGYCYGTCYISNDGVLPTISYIPKQFPKYAKH